MSLLTIAQDLCDLVGIARPTSVGANADPTYAQIRAIVQQATNDLFSRHDWRALLQTRDFTSIAGTRQPGMLPPDYARMADGHTMWDLRTNEAMAGPLSPTQWSDVERFNSGLIYRVWRLQGSDIAILPAPGAGAPFRFEYIGKNVIRQQDGTMTDRWQNDADTSILPETLILLSAVWRWKSSKGFAYAEDLSNFEREFDRLASADAALQPIIVADGRRVWPDPLTTSKTPSGPINASGLRVLASNGYGD